MSALRSLVLLSSLVATSATAHAQTDNFLAEILTRIYVDGRKRRIYTVEHVTHPFRASVDRLVR